MASNDPPSSSQTSGSGPGTHPSASNYLPDLPLVEDLQPLLGSGYVVESFLGQGGMGAVYKGLQMPLRRPVAIKILQKRAAAGGEDDFAFEERFKREAYAMAALTHPHIVQVYDCGDAGSNFLFISMELVEGGDLSDALKARQVTPELALKLIPQICDGLQAAHERGIVHRDIKPANIFLTKDGRAKVADFGLAKKFDAKNTLVTKAGLGMGTPDYAAPEQFDGVEDLDHRADIYSLGVMMYQMLTGRLPRGATFKMPSQLVGVDPRIDAIVAKALESEREDRYQSVAQIKADLAQITATFSPSSPAPLNTGAIPVIERPVTAPRPVTVTRPATSTKPATTTRPVSQPARRPASGVMPGVPPKVVAIPDAKKKPNLALIGAIAGVVVMGLGATFLFKKPTRPDPPPGGAAPTASPSSSGMATTSSQPTSPPASSSPPATGNVVPGQWTRVSREQLRLPAGQMQGDKILLPAESYANSELPPIKNAVVRLKVKRADDVPFGLRIVQRSDTKSIYAFAAVPTASTPQGMIQVSPTANSADRKIHQAACDSLAPGKESTFEFLAVNEHYMLIIDGKTVAMCRDDRTMQQGKIQLFSGRGAVELRELEVLVLDGLSEDKFPGFVKDALGKSRAASPASSQSPPLAMKTSEGDTAPSGDFPPGKWVTPIRSLEDLPEVHRKSGTVKWEDGWLKPTDPAKGFGFSIPGFTARNMAIRGVMRNPGTNPSGGPVLQTRITSNAGRYEVMPSESSLAISHLKEPARTSLAKGTRRLVVTPDRDIPIEMAVVGKQIYARADGALAVRATDDRLANGNAGIHSKSWMRDLEVINLDGIPEAEALRLIGVDEQGNDLRLPDSEKFTPGQWTKIYTQADHLPPDVRLPASGVTWDDGWIRYDKPRRLYLPPSLTGNYAVRARFQRLTEKDNAKITLRNQSLTGAELYRLFNSDGNQLTCEALNGSEVFPLFTSSVPAPGKSDSEYTMEFGAVGNRLVGRLNDSLVKIASDDRYKTGHAYITGSESTRDIEVINLNGLSEAEALRLLGVDEAGNDLRPQERQRIAQARMNEAIAAIPELKQLHDQFLALQSERVTVPFEADLARLNASYLGGLDRALSEAKAAGRADDMAALETEKKLIADRQPMPRQDDEKLTETVKKLRGIYRSSLPPLEAQRESGLKALTGPLQTRLTTLAADFTAKGREADATVVQEFMATLAAGIPAAASAPVPAAAESVPATTGATPASTGPARTFTPADPRAAAEWVFSLGGTVDIDDRGTRRTIRRLEELPKGRVEILKVWLDKNKSIGDAAGTFTSLEPIAGLKKLTHLETHFYDIQDADTDVLASFPALATCQINDARKFTGERMGLLRGLADLDMLHLGGSGITGAGLKAVAPLKRVTRMDLSNTPLTDEDLAALAEMKNLRMLTIRSTKLTAAALAHLKKLDALTEFGWRFQPGTAVDHARLISQLFPSLVTLTMETSRDLPGSEITGAFAHFSNLDKVVLSNGPLVSDDQGQALAGVQTLTTIHFAASPAITDVTFEALASHKNLKSLRVDGAAGLTRTGLLALVRLKSLARLELRDNKQLDEAAFTEFKKQRPDVNVVK